MDWEYVGILYVLNISTSIAHNDFSVCLRTMNETVFRFFIHWESTDSSDSSQSSPWSFGYVL